MSKRLVTLVAFGVALALSSPLRTQERLSSDADEQRKLDAALDFLRTRNAQDYAVSRQWHRRSEVPEGWRHRPVDHHPRRGSRQSCRVRVARRAGRRHQSVGVCLVSALG